MKLLTYNILEGGTGRIDPLAEVIRQSDPDVVFIAEAWDESLFHKLADRLGLDCFHAVLPGNASAAVGVLSKLPIHEAVNYGPQHRGFTRSAMHAIVETPKGNLLPIFGVHLHPRETLADEDKRLGELAALFAIADPFAGRPHILCGDFNTSHPDQPIDPAKLRPKVLERIALQGHQLPREVVRKLLERGYVDAHSLHHAPEEFDTTFTTSHPAMRVDYFFVTPDLCPHVQGCDAIHHPLARYASDHFPVLLTVDF